MTTTLVEKDSYFDSVFLMLVNGDVKKRPGIRDAVVAMGTEMNIALLEEMGLADSAVRGAGPGDLVIVIDAESPAAAADAEAAAKELLTKKKKRGAGEIRRPRSLGAAVKENPGTNLAVISIPGVYAAREARSALEKGLHVMLFSDNVSLEEEISLKRRAEEKGLLMMGPDCGTAIINGQPLCFANVVRRGPIGLVAASGTGLQEVSCLIDAAGGGISQAIGTGGRDLKSAEVGGRTTLLGIEALRRDSATEVIVVISKPPADPVAEKVLARLKDIGKPVVVHFIGRDGSEQRGDIRFAGNLEEAALMAVALASGTRYEPVVFTRSSEEIDAIVDRETRGLAPEQRYLRGLFTGGTVADEALVLLEEAMGAVYSNNQKDPRFQLSDPKKSMEHTVVDLGDDIYTVGRPHPMIDPSTRNERIDTEGDDPQMAVLLMDVVLGYGSHPDPAGAAAESIRIAREKAVSRGGYLPVVVSVIGTEGDYQGYRETLRTLENLGCVVMPSNVQASRLALKIARKASA